METEVRKMKTNILDLMLNIVQNAVSVLGHHNKNFKSALTHAFPEIGLEKKYYHIPRTPYFIYFVIFFIHIFKFYLYIS
jgi:hypothetical protein